MITKVRVAGHLDDHWCHRTGATALVREAEAAATTLSFEIVDQAHLHGILGMVRDLGIRLLSVSNVEDEATPPPALDKVLRTARLTIRPPAVGDAAATWSYRRLQSVSEWLTWLAKTEDEYTENFLDPARLAMTAVVELNGAIVGDLMIKVEDPWSQAEIREQASRKQVEIGYCLDPRYSAKGYATEAVKEVLRYCFEDLGVHRIVAHCFADNETSWRLMERLGMRRELHALDDSLHRSGRWHDSYGYALLHDEWRNRTARETPECRRSLHHP